jgi:IMP dehydrogenase
MAHSNKILPTEGLTFDDVLLVPGYSDFSRSDIKLKTKLTKKLHLNSPFVSSPMDTVTEEHMAVELAQAGGVGIIHRNLPTDKQAEMVSNIKKRTFVNEGRAALDDQGKLLVGAAVGASPGFEERVEALAKAGVDVIIVDSAHGNAHNVIAAISFIKNKYKNIEVIGGSIATFEGAENLIKAGADALRVGMGPGAICTTRIVSGMGVPQITAIMETVRAATPHEIPVIADGGIKYSGDMVKALAAGASTVMMGSFFASCKEAPGEIYELTADQVPARFKSIVKEDHPKDHTYTFKTYRGMGSEGAMKEGARIKSEDEFHGHSYKDRVLIAEGVEGLVPVKGTVQDLIEQARGGIKSGMYYVGAKTIPELQEKAQFMKITQASLTESHPHDILVTNTGKSYQ